MSTKRLFLIGLLLVVGAGAVGAWMWQSNLYSKDVLWFEVTGPETASVGNEITYTVRYKNNGDVLLEDVHLTFEYPEGTIPSDENPLRVTRDLEDIYPGDERTISFRGRLFGEEGAQKQARARVTFSPRNLTVVNDRETTFTTVISSSPLNFNLTIPTRTEGGQIFEFELAYASRVAYPLSSVRIEMEYPEAFELVEVSREPINEGEWQIGVLNRDEGGRILFRGRLHGDVGDVANFRAVIGTWHEGEFMRLAEEVRGVEIAQPSIRLSQRVNLQEEYFASPGELLHYEISFRNVGDRILEDLFLTVDLDGRPLDVESVRSPSGRVARGGSTIVWEAQESSKLRFLGVGEEGTVEFWARVHEDLEVFSPQDKNFAITNRVSLSDVVGEFQVKLQAQPSLDQQLLFNEGPFVNSGPIPPQAGSPTTYTVVWQLHNAYSDVKDTVVTARLPSHVRFRGNVTGDEAEHLVYDAADREITWDLGRVQAGTGHFDSLPPPTVLFQVELTPQQQHVGNPAILLDNMRISGEDAYTLQELEISVPELDTVIDDDEDRGRVRS